MIKGSIIYVWYISKDEIDNCSDFNNILFYSILVPDDGLILLALLIVFAPFIFLSWIYLNFIAKEKEYSKKNLAKYTFWSFLLGIKIKK